EKTRAYPKSIRSSHGPDGPKSLKKEPESAPSATHIKSVMRAPFRERRPAGVVQDLPHLHAGRLRAAHHVSRAVAAGEGHDAIRLAVSKDGLVADRAGGLAVLLPLRAVLRDRDALASSPHAGQMVSPTRATVDHDVDAPLAMHTVEDGGDAVDVLVVAAA